MLQREKTTHHNEDPTCCNYDMVLPNKYNFFFNFRKGEQITDTDNNMVESQNHYAMWEKLDAKVYVLYDSMYIKI